MANVLSTGRRLWRALAPEGLRHQLGPISGRLVFEATIRSLAAHKGAAGEGPPALVGFFSGSSGLAASAERASRALEALDIAHRRIDVGALASPHDPGPRSARAWIFHLNPPELMHLLFRWRGGALQGPRFAYWAWELPRAPRAWRRAVTAMDGVMVPSRYTADAFVPRETTVTPHPLFADDVQENAQSRRRTAADAFRVVSLFDFKSSAARKNPLGAIQAFQTAFGSDPSATLILKMQNAAIAPDLARALTEIAGPNVQIIDEAWPYARVRTLIASADALLSLHRAEGFGMTLAEAMALGTPVVATDWSGNRDFMDAESACLVPATLTAVVDPQGVYQSQTWAEPDIGVAAQHLQRLRDDPAFAEGIAARARARVMHQLSPQAWFESLPASLRTSLAG